MRIRLTRNDGQSKPDVLFRGIPEKGPWAPFSFSICLHTALVGIGVSYLHFLAMLPPDSIFEVRRDRVLDLSTDPIVYSAPPAPTSAADQQAGPKNRSQRAQSRSRPSEAGAGPRVPLPAPALAAREFKMPAMRTLRPVQQTLVQMDLPPTMDVHQQLRVPAIVMLASTPKRLAAKPFVAPPERKRTMEVPSQVALEMRPPVLDVRAGHAKTPEVLSEITPRLPAPVGAVAPVASNREPAEAKPAAATVTAAAASEPSNIISLPDSPIPAASAIVLPPLNQVSGRDVASGAAGPLDPSGGKASSGKAGPGEVPGSSNSQSTQSGGNGSAPTHNGAGGNVASNASGNSAGGHSPGAGAAQGGNSPAGSAGRTGAEGSGAGGSGTKPGAGSSGNGASSTGAASTGPTQPRRIIRPGEGRYEVAIVQSSAAIPGTAGLLKGRPVYSVYVPVGTSKEWILQYCLPTDEARSAARSQIVQLGNVTPITGPYAFSIVGPTVQFRAGVRYAFIHGYVNVSGRFEQLAEAGDEVIENIEAVLESLGQWEFRPATKDGVPAIVEILLCIPNAA